MGVKDLTTPYIRESASETNINLKDVTQIQDIILGFDMSVIILQKMRAKSTFIESYHMDPRVPMIELEILVVQEVKKYLDKFGVKKAVCVFDGMPNKLKVETAYKKRYATHESLKNKLIELYKKQNFDSEDEKQAAIKEVQTLQKELSPIRDDIVYGITKRLKESLRERVVNIGAPFEADHQLAYLAKEKVIDYVITSDSDLTCLGANVLLNVQENGKCWEMTFDNFINDRLPNKFKTDNIVWTQDHLIQLAMFLGCDYIDRIPGHGKTKVKGFIESISPDIRNEEELYRLIHQDFTIASHCTVPVKQFWLNEQQKSKHMKTWMEASDMFHYGPVFVLTPTNDVSLREAIFTESFNVNLGRMDGDTESSWEITNQSEMDLKYGRKFLVGFDPKADLIEHLEQHFDWSSNEKTEEEVYSSMMQECCTLQRFARTGKLLSALPFPRNNNGDEVYHGAIINFDRIPPFYFSKSKLSFWLECRQIKSPDSLDDIIYFVHEVWSKYGNRFQPIAKNLMRGEGGWVEEEILVPTSEQGEVDWKHGTDFVEIITRIMPQFDDNSFTCLFGKRNGTRKRILKHVKGGSFNIKTMKATKDLSIQGENDSSVLVIEGECAPSQKLKDGGKDAFHNIRLCIELNADGGFQKFLHHPYTRCVCPNGCIFCAHIGGLLAYCHCIKKLMTDNSGLDFEKLQNVLPQPVHELMQLVIALEYMYPKNTSERRIQEKQNSSNSQGRGQGRGRGRGRGHAGQGRGSSRNDDVIDDQRIDIQELEEVHGIEDMREFFLEHASMNELAIAGVPDTSNTPTLEVISELNEWANSIINGWNEKGKKNYSKKDIEDFTTELSKRRRDPKYIATQLKVLKRLEKVLDKKHTRDTRTKKKVKKPLLVDLLSATTIQRNAKQNELKEQYPENEINLRELVFKPL